MKRHLLHRADPSPVALELFSVVETGLSSVYPARRDAVDPYGWLFAPGYPPSMSAFGRVRGALTVRLCEQLPRGRTLEVAAGGGGLAAALAAEGREVVVNDIRTEELRSSLSSYNVPEGRVREVGGNVFDLESDSLGAFELVVACEVIEHVAHPDRLLSHLASFLSPGGRILITTPNGEFFRNRLPTFLQIDDPDALESEQFKPDADGHLFLLTAGELSSLASDAGLKIESMFVWATPLLTGHAGLRMLEARRTIPLARAGEALAQLLPERVRRSVCYSLFATLVRA